jgi:histone demethylase JARID1
MFQGSSLEICGEDFFKLEINKIKETSLQWLAKAEKVRYEFLLLHVSLG